jgi:hypothetical protein
MNKVQRWSTSSRSNKEADHFKDTTVERKNI